MPEVAGDPCAALEKALADAQAQLAGDTAKRDKLRGELELDAELKLPFPSPGEYGSLSVAAHGMFSADTTLEDLEHQVTSDRAEVDAAQVALATCRATQPIFEPERLIIERPAAVESVVGDLGTTVGTMATSVIAADVAANPLSSRPGKVVTAIDEPITESGGVKIPMLGGAIICGLLTLVLIGVAAGGDDTKPVPTSTSTQAATATPASTTAASATARPAVTLASPAVGSPVFVNFQNPLAEVVISGFGAPPPGTHLDHVSTFRMQATGTGLVYLWTLTNPVCGALAGAPARTASVTWDHSKCGTLESAARISVTVVRAADLGPDGAPGAAAAYFTYAQTARAGDSFATDPLPKNEQLQYFGPASVPPPTAAPATAVLAASTPAPVTQSGSRLPWAPIAAAVSAVACAALVWRSGVLSALRG